MGVRTPGLFWFVFATVGVFGVAETDDDQAIVVIPQPLIIHCNLIS